MHEERLKAGQESKEEAKTESSGCLKVFFDALNRVLAEKGVDVNYSLTEAESLFKALDVAVWANTIPLCEVVDLIKTEAKIVSTPTPRNNACIEALKAQLCNEKVISDFRLRCDECCPMCGIQCDHPKGRGHDGLHQSFHQPDGLIGVKYHKTDILSEHSCITSAKFEHCIVRDDKNLPYRKFNEAFPKWKDLDYNLESRATPLKVREYLFFHKQDLIHSLYPTAKRNENIHKCGYNHDITVLKAELRAVIKENMA